MTQSKRRFFIALLPPVEIQQFANKIKQHFAEVYNSRAAQKSPPHITLQPPFEWKIEDLAKLEQKLAEFARSQFPVPMTLDGFSAFKPRVIFINVLKNPELVTIQKTLMDELESSLGIVHEVSKNRPFSPHLTVGFRDLTKANFYKAWDEFKDRQLHFEFLVPQLTLLIHNGHCWETHQEFLLSKKE
ncbi:MAG: 2'-5' RNA ligase family protein [Hydrococcus sp. RU_2_2]|jgi:2'-5' RNA ligase|nr:2'-5' RNA ligase family protein [Hydrococcus sp. RU_2_2]NJP18144.1 2'-5' RNA ligase family protein [Hydrococcus sp. CRU_1_1]